MIKLHYSNVSFADLCHGRELISSSDAYTQQLSAFELQAKVRTMNAATEGDYLRNATQFVRPWTGNEIAYLKAIIGSTDSRIQALGLQLDLPKDIFIVKTTGWEEGGANGYTRGNVIYLNRSSISQKLFHHELFHLISRFASPSRLDSVYGVLGFKPTESIEFNDDRRISNPDAPALRHVIHVRYRNKMAAAAIVLRGNRPYSGGGFFPYVQKRLLLVEEEEGHLIPFESSRNLYSQIGRNTSYNIHQEEISAVHFEYLLASTTGIPNPHLVESLHRVLAE